MSLTFAIDYDGTVIDEGQPPRLRPGARQALRVLRAAGHRLVLFSCRCTPLDPGGDPSAESEEFYATGFVPERVAQQWSRFTSMRRALALLGLLDLFDEVWQSPGKPMADLYIDDRAELPDWASIVREFGVRSAHA